MLKSSSGTTLKKGLRLSAKKLIWGALCAISVGYAEIRSLETSHFRICETLPNEKIVVKYGDLVSPELECVNIYQTKFYEISKNELLLSRVIGHGTGFNVEELTLIRVVSDTNAMNFFTRIFSNKKSLEIYNASNRQIFDRLRKRTKFHISENEMVIAIDGKEIHRQKLNIDTNCYIDYADECFTFDLGKQSSISINICKKHRYKIIYPDYICSIKFDIQYKTSNSTLEITLKNPRFEA